MTSKDLHDIAIFLFLLLLFHHNHHDHHHNHHNRFQKPEPLRVPGLVPRGAWMPGGFIQVEKQSLAAKSSFTCSSSSSSLSPSKYSSSSISQLRSQPVDAQTRNNLPSPGMIGKIIFGFLEMCRSFSWCFFYSFFFRKRNSQLFMKRRIIFLMWTKHVIFILSQNGTAANNPSAQPLKAVSQYYMVKYQSLIIQCFQVMIVWWCFHNHHSQVKMSIRSDRVCKRPWNFERVPNKQIEGNDKVEFIIKIRARYWKRNKNDQLFQALIFTSTKEACLAACLNEVSVEFSLNST